MSGEAASTQKGYNLTSYLGDYLALLSGVKITPESIPQVDTFCCVPSVD